MFQQKSCSPGAHGSNYLHRDIFLSLSMVPPSWTPETSTSPPTMFFHQTPIISCLICWAASPSCSFGNSEWKKEVSQSSVRMCHAHLQGAVCAHPDREEINPRGTENIRAKSSTCSWERSLQYSAKSTVGCRRLSRGHIWCCTAGSTCFLGFGLQYSPSFHKQICKIQRPVQVTDFSSHYTFDPSHKLKTNQSRFSCLCFQSSCQL